MSLSDAWRETACSKYFSVSIDVCVEDFSVSIDVCVEDFSVSVDVCVEDFSVSIDVCVEDFSVSVDVCVEDFSVSVDVCVEDISVSVDVCVEDISVVIMEECGIQAFTALGRTVMWINLRGCGGGRLVHKVHLSLKFMTSTLPYHVSGVAPPLAHSPRIARAMP